ncbi:MAG: hypothetical protein Q9187_008655 [Circinaria calcarea]
MSDRAAMAGGVVSLEVFLAGLEPFRVAYPGKAALFPDDTHMATDAPIHRFTDFSHPKLKQILESHKIAYSSMGLVRRREQQGSRPVFRVLTTDLEPENWENAAKEIHEFFSLQSFANIKVELENPGEVTKGVIFPIPSSHPKVTAYLNLETEFMNSVRYRLGSLWRSVGLYLLGTAPREGFCKPVIVITVTPGSSHDWAVSLTILERIAHKIQVGVELNPGTVSNAAGEVQRNLLPKPYNGVSIGLQGDFNSSSGAQSSPVEAG